MRTLKSAILFLTLLWTLPESRSCFSIPSVPPDQEQVYRLSKDSIITDSTGGVVDALVFTTRTILYTGTAFLVTDTLRLRPGNPYPYHREIVVVKRDSSALPPRELDLCQYADSIDTVLTFEDDSLYIAFLPGERGQGSIMALFSLKEGFLYYYGSGHHPSEWMASREDEEGLRKREYAMTYQDRQPGSIRADKRVSAPKPQGFPGFAFRGARFDAVGRRILDIAGNP